MGSVAGARGHFIDIAGIRTHYIILGEGPTIVLMHGASFGCDMQCTWLYQLETLSRDFRVIAFDQVGFGYTDMPQDLVYRNRLERAEHAVGLLDALNISGAVLVGHSEGAFTATWIAIHYPQIVSRLIIMTSGGTSPAFNDERDKEWMEASRRMYDCDGGQPSEDEHVTAIRRQVGRWEPRLDAEIRNSYRRAVGNQQFEMLRRAPQAEQDYALYTRLQEQHIFPDLHKLKSPVLLLWSRNDATVPLGRGLLLLDMLPHADFHAVSNTGHALMLTRPAAVNGVLRGWCRDVP